MSVAYDNKKHFKAYVDAQAQPATDTYHAAVMDAFAKDAQINVCHPFNLLDGPTAYHAAFLRPLGQAFAGLHRRDDIVMGGAFDGGDWVTCTGYYVGHFGQDWLGIKATGTLSYLRFGEFHRYEDGSIVESYIFLDLPQLMIAAGQWPINDSPGQDRGYTGFVPGPASQDGLHWGEPDPARSRSSAALVTDMLRKLATKEEAWRPYWHDNMMWYGPGAFGSFVGIENFAGFQVPFEGAFEGWAGGAAGNERTRHFTRFADGDYICTGGWPSLSGVQVKPFLDQPASNKMLYMRVCDWWRRAGDKLIENWVFVDIPDVLLQLGVDLFPDHPKSA